MYVMDNVSNAGHYREISYDRANRTPTQSGGVLLCPEGVLYIDDLTDDLTVNAPNVPVLVSTRAPRSSWRPTCGQHH